MLIKNLLLFVIIVVLVFCAILYTRERIWGYINCGIKFFFSYNRCNGIEQFLQQELKDRCALVHRNRIISPIVYI